jgi:proline iminopeptidase
MKPDEFTIEEAFIDVGDGFQIYAMDWGNKKATLPIIRLHGGPGSMAKNRHLELYNPYEQRVIVFDQRGCGRSLPYGALENNTTDKLVEDISKVADHFKIDQFILTGSSWGSCLALAYALKYPKRVTAMALQGVFTGSQSEIDYLDSGKFQTFFPEVWEHFVDQTPKEFQKDPAAYHMKRMLGENPEAIASSAYAYSSMEGGADLA